MYKIYKLAALVFGFSVVLSGCFGHPHSMIDYSDVDLVDGKGRITLDGEPLPLAQVFFEDVKNGTLAFALTDSDGRYSLMFNSLKSGVEAGEKQVRIWTARGGIEFRDKIPRENLGRSKERVPQKYNSKSELFRTVLSSKESRSQTFDFELDSKGVIAQKTELAE
ncbi:MAG: carboxypeptidase-like regulatory domain-containing protein [Thermoguttaceae bacterium]